jgi:D-glycero-D-manno-heptose 1,7-bisphosphate phosphatase
MPGGERTRELLIMDRAIFMDRDGTISEEVGYVYHSGLYRVFSWSGPAIRKINEHGMKAIVITNQSGVGRGYFDEASVEEVHGILRTELASQSAKLDAIYACIHHPEAGCDCRKPSPGMLLKARDEMNIDLSQSYVIGDKYLDVETAHNVGAKGILVLTGYGREEREKYKSSGKQPDLVADNLMAAVDAILGGRCR